jgi:hypothetical protein
MHPSKKIPTIPMFIKEVGRIGRKYKAKGSTNLYYTEPKELKWMIRTYLQNTEYYNSNPDCPAALAYWVGQAKVNNTDLWDALKSHLTHNLPQYTEPNLIKFCLGMKTSGVEISGELADSF